MTSYATGLKLTESIISASLNIDPQKQVVIAGRRTTGGTLITPPQGSSYPMPNLFKPFQLPVFTDGVSAVNYLVNNYGYNVVWGVNFTRPLPAPSMISSAQSDGSRIFTWNTIPYLFQELAAVSLSGSITQNSDTGTIVQGSVRINGTQATMRVKPNGMSTFNTSDVLTLNGTNNIQKPNPELSDEIVVGVFAFYNQATRLPLGQTQASAWISVLNDDCSTLNPTSSPIALGNPSAVAINSDGSQTLTYPVATSGLGYLPTTSLGASTVAQTFTLPTDSTVTIYHANGIFLRGSGDGAGIDYSTDGIDWQHTNVTTHNVNKFFWNGSVFVAATNAGLYYSVNGISWTVSNINTGTFNDVSFANTKFVAAGATSLQYSSNGITWTECTGDGMGADAFASITYSTSLSLWVVVGANGAFSSTDGITFAAIVDAAGNYTTVASGNGLIQIGVSTGGIIYSDDGINFNPSTLTTHTPSTITFNTALNLWLAGTDAGIYSSANGLTWTVTNVSTGAAKQFATDGTTIIVAYSTGVYHSTNGTTWTIGTGAGLSGTYLTVCVAEGVFLAAGAAGVIQSTNGIAFSSGSANVSGTYNGFALDGLGNALINVKPVVGNFVTSSPVVVTLDVTQSYFNYLGNYQLNYYVLPFQITSLTDLTNTQSTFYNGISNLNNGYGINQQKFAPTGYYANLTPVGQLYSLQTPNSQYFKGTWKPDQPTAIDYPETPISVAAASAYLDANCNIPFFSQANVVLALSASSDSTTYASVERNGDCDTAVSLGWTPFAVDSNSQVYCWRNVTSLITIPNTSISDVEFRYVSVWLKQRWLQQQVWALWQRVSTATGLQNGGMVLNSPAVQQDMLTGCQSILVTGQNLEMFQNVSAYSGLVTVTLDPTLPTGFDVKIPNQVVPELATANVDVQLYSIYYDFTS